MTDLLLEIGLSNLCLSLALAFVAWMVHRTGKRPFLAHMLWLLVLVKLLTPPFWTIPVVTIPGSATSTAGRLVVPTEMASLVGVTDSTTLIRGVAEASPRAATSWSTLLEQGKVGLAVIWLLGVLGILVWSSVRICLFARLLNMASELAPSRLQSVAAEMARRLGLPTCPTVYTTAAQISPLVWWLGGKVRVLLPAPVIQQMEERQLQWVLAHELAHVKRRDHLVRWLEWLACACFWWNPVAWWARRYLRANEEVCCDAMVLSCLKPQPRTYANSLLTVVEFLAAPPLHTPAMASEINSGGFLERRLEMIVAEKPIVTKPRWLRALVVLCAMVVLPLGIASAQDYKAVARRLKRAVKKGEITQQHADAMMTTLKKMGEKNSDRGTDVDLDAMGRKFRAAVARGDLTAEEGRAKMQYYRKRMGSTHDWRKKKGSDTGLKDHFNEMGISEEALGRIKKALVENGIKGKQIEPTLGGFLRIIYEMNSEGDSFEPDPRILEYYSGTVGLSRKQIHTVIGLAERVCQRLAGAHSEGGEGSHRLTREDYEHVEARLKQAVNEGEVSERNARARLERMRKAMAEESQREELYWEAIKTRIEGAVKSGRMTREEADAQYRELKAEYAKKQKRDR